MVFPIFLYAEFFEMNKEITVNEIIISSLSEETLEETVKFISSCQSVDESYVAWLGYSPEEIEAQLMDIMPSYQERCLIAIYNGAVCGFLGIYVSEEQTNFRLLGPYISLQESWNEIAINLLSALREKIPGHLSMAKVAFYEANVNCKRVYETNFFAQYNAEKTLIMDRSMNSLLGALNETINTRYYQSCDFNEFIQIHPTNAYFTGSEVVKRLDQFNRLIIAELDSRVIGYIYFEMLKSDECAEICFVNVSLGFRNRGIGSVLINRVITEVFKYNWINHIQISVRVNNEEAERLYTRIGFKEKSVIIALQRDLITNPWGDFTYHNICTDPDL